MSDIVREEWWLRVVVLGLMARRILVEGEGRGVTIGSTVTADRCPAAAPLEIVQPSKPRRLHKLQ